MRPPRAGSGLPCRAEAHRLSCVTCPSRSWVTMVLTTSRATTPLPECAGLGIEGPRHRLEIQAESDECLLDQTGVLQSRGLAGMAAGPLIAELVAKTGCNALTTDDLLLDAPIASLATEFGASFSTAAKSVADQARASYRALNG